MASTMSRMQYTAGRPPLPASHAGDGSSGSHTAHSASVMSEGYRRLRELRLRPPGQHRQGTGADGWPAAAEWTAAGGTRYNGTQGSWDRAGFDTQAITRGLCYHSDATPSTTRRSRTLRLRPMPSFQAGSKSLLENRGRCRLGRIWIFLGVARCVADVT